MISANADRAFRWNTQGRKSENDFFNGLFVPQRVIAHTRCAHSPRGTSHVFHTATGNTETRHRIGSPPLTAVACKQSPARMIGKDYHTKKPPPSRVPPCRTSACSSRIFRQPVSLRHNIYDKTPIVRHGHSRPDPTRFPPVPPSPIRIPSSVRHLSAVPFSVVAPYLLCAPRLGDGGSCCTIPIGAVSTAARPISTSCIRWVSPCR